MKTNSWIFIAIGVIVLGGLFFILKPKGSVENRDITALPSVSSEGSSSTAPQSGKVFELMVKNKKLVTGPGIIQVIEGDEVTIKITSDEEEELHIHGYDKSVDLEANEPAELKFTANLTGRFPYELETSKTEIGALEVQPKK